MPLVGSLGMLGSSGVLQPSTSPPQELNASANPFGLPGNGNTAPSSTAPQGPSAQNSKSIPFLSDGLEKFGTGGGGFRSIDEKFTVNPSSGTLSLSLPIQTSKGRSGFGPSLALSYDSGFGNGPFGFGWSMSLDSVTRKVSLGIPTYTDADTFILSGQEDLVAFGLPENRLETLSGSQFSVQPFQPRVLGEAIRIERWSSLENDKNVYWRTITGDNVTRIFGKDSDSRIHDDSTGTSRIFSWLLSECYDGRGNCMMVTYKSEDASGLRVGSHDHTKNKHIETIKYGNTIPNRDMKDWNKVIPTHTLTEKGWLFEVLFDYGEYEVSQNGVNRNSSWLAREDPFSMYTAGFELRTNRLCRNIIMMHHFPEKTGDLVVSSVALTYNETGRGSFLKSFRNNGYMLTEDGVWISESSPPFELTYSLSPDVEDLLLKTADAPTIFQMQGNERPLWVDLDAEGLPGLLRRVPCDNGGWVYQKNENALNNLDKLKNGELGFSRPISLSSQPTLNKDGGFLFESLGGNGIINLVCIDDEGRLLGFHERMNSSEWSDMQHFKSVPNFDRGENSLALLDVTGDGCHDVVQIAEDLDSVVWYPSLGKEGYGGAQTVKRATERGPLWSYGRDVTKPTYLADMSGDGLSDIVQVSSGGVSYWPNMGYGNFGSEIIMANSPIFDRDSFDPRRLQLVDIDGSGTTDIVYILPGGGARLHYNLAGNGWSDGYDFVAFPDIDDPASVFITDLFGQGFPCLCALVMDSTGTSQKIHYINFSGRVKPHLLTSYTNGCGLTTEVEYQPSTKFYLEDRVKSPWPQPLPSPVQCVVSQRVRDVIAQTAIVTRYAYHDGFFDHAEKEFRGFGLVETWVEEDLAVGSSKKHQAPPIYTKTWFMTGTPVVDDLSRASPSDSPHLVSVIPLGKGSYQWHESHRALKGGQRRHEIFRCGSELMPQRTLEYSYEVIPIQEATSDSHGISRVIQREALTCDYGIGAAPEVRVQHDATLAVNEYGDVQRSIKINYGRNDNILKKDDDLNDAVGKQQGETIASILEASFTNAVEEADNFRKPVQCITTENRISGLGKSIYKLDDLTGFNLDSFTSVGHEESLVGAEKKKVLVAESRTQFSGNDASRKLDFGKLEAFSIEFQTFHLALTKGILNEITPHFKGNLTDLMKSGGYASLEEDSRWWVPSPRFCFRDSGGVESDIVAKSSFYIANNSTDAFGNRYQASLDTYKLLLEKVVDPLGSTVSLVNDYRTLQPVEKKDINGNRKRVILNAFAEVIGSAVMGKESESIGDSLDRFQVALPANTIDAMLNSPTQQLLQKVLGGSTSRNIYAWSRYYESNPSEHVPNLVITLTRQEHTHPDSLVMLSVSYLSGRRKVIETVDLISHETESEWRSSGQQVVNSNGITVRQFQSRMTTNAHFLAQSSVVSPSTFFFLDALSQEIGTVSTDGRWSKTRFLAWSREDYSAGNTVEMDISDDDDVGLYASGLDPSFIPSWYNLRVNSSEVGMADSAAKSQVYAGKHLTSQLNAKAQLISTTRQLGNVLVRERFTFDACGRPAGSWDTIEHNGQLTERQTERFLYDLSGCQLYLSSMDAGSSWSIADCLGDVMVSNNSRSITKRFIRDSLRRMAKVMVSQGDASEVVYHQYSYGRDSSAEVNNLRGAVVEILDQSGVFINNSFDFKGNLLSSTRQFTDEYKSVINWDKREAIPLATDKYTTYSTFNALDLTSTTTDASGNSTKYTFDLAGRVKTVQWKQNSSSTWDSYATSTSYTHDNQQAKIDYGNGTTTSFTFDETTRQMVQKTTTRATRNSKTRVLENWTMTYDCLNKLISKRNLSEEIVFYKNAAVKPSTSYTYDELGRLTQCMGREQEKGAWGRPFHNSVFANQGLDHDSQAKVVGYLETYKYDVAGNILSLRHEPVDQPNGQSWTRYYAYEEPSLLEPDNSGNRLTSITVGNYTETFGYDDDAGSMGCITAMAGFSDLGWDLENRLRSTSQQVVQDGVGGKTWHVYDFAGNRVRKVTDNAAASGDTPRIAKEVIYLPGIDLQFKFDGKGRKTDTKLTARVESVRGCLALIESTEAEGNATSNEPLVRYQTGHGLETDDNGSLISYEEYSPFGTTAYAAMGEKIEAPSRYRYASYDRDTETGFYYCKARFYAPWICRWISADPLGSVEGLNLYEYCGNDPVNRSDPTGTCSDDEEPSVVVFHADPDESPSTQSEKGEAENAAQSVDENISSNNGGDSGYNSEDDSGKNEETEVKKSRAPGLLRRDSTLGEETADSASDQASSSQSTPVDAPKTYPIYLIEYLGKPRNHHSIFMKTAADGSGELFHVIGHIAAVGGMTYEHRVLDRAPDGSSTFAAKHPRGWVDEHGRDRIDGILRGVTPPIQQLTWPAKRLFPDVPLRRCQEWTEDAFKALRSQGVLQPL